MGATAEHSNRPIWQKLLWMSRTNTLSFTVSCGFHNTNRPKKLFDVIAAYKHAAVVNKQKNKNRSIFKVDGEEVLHPRIIGDVQNPHPSESRKSPRVSSDTTAKYEVLSSDGTRVIYTPYIYVLRTYVYIRTRELCYRATPFHGAQATVCATQRPPPSGR